MDTGPLCWEEFYCYSRSAERALHSVLSKTSETLAVIQENVRELEQDIQDLYSLDEILATLKDRVADAETVVVCLEYFVERLWKQYMPYLRERHYDSQSRDWSPPLPPEILELENRYNDFKFKLWKAKDHRDHIASECERIALLLPMVAQLIRSEI